MKAILMSIHPKWCEKIFCGLKTIEVRKTAPKLETPFKVYVYQTKIKFKVKNWQENFQSIVFTPNGGVEEGNGKVIGSFVCNSATCCQAYYGEGGEKHLTNTFGIDLKRACLTEDELFNYIIGKHGEIGTGWLWHITEPKQYDTPRELGEFKTPDKPYHEIIERDGSLMFMDGYERGKPLTRAPQSWQYVEEVAE